MDTMPMKQLPNGVLIPQLGFGVFRSPEGTVTADSVRWAIEAGYRHIDTAAIYGNEASVGEGIASCGIPRDQLFITGKIWNQDMRQGNEEKAFLAACLLAGQDTNGNTLLAKAWKEHIEREKSASLERRMIKLLDMQWDGNYASSLWRIVKMLDRKDIDYEKLAWDIIHWDDEDRNVQKNWLRMIYSEDQIKVKEEK